MQSSAPTNNAWTEYYTTAFAAFRQIAHGYCFLGRLREALDLLQTSLDLAEATEVALQDRLRLLLLRGRVLTVEHLIYRGDAEPMLASIERARQLAERAQLQPELANALCLLGQAHCNATTVAILKSGALPFGARGQGRYEEALAYQEQALALLESLHDTRGISESHFQIGLVYQFWQQNELACEHFNLALQIAEQHGHIFEQSEPNRHLTVDALFKGDLDLALLYARRALSLREASGFKPYQPFDHIMLRDIYLKQGDKASAQFHTQQALSLAEEMGFAELMGALLNATQRLGEVQ